MSLNSLVFFYKFFSVVCLATEQWLWVVNENIILDIWFTLSEELYDSLIMIIKTNHEESPEKTVQPQELYGPGLG